MRKIDFPVYFSWPRALKVTAGNKLTFPNMAIWANNTLRIGRYNIYERILN